MSRLRLLSFLLAALLPLSALGADSTVSSMTAASALNGAELTYCVQGGADRKCTFTQVQTFINTFPMTIVGGTSGGIPYFSSTTALSSSALLAANALMIGGGAGAAPSTTTTGTGVLTALGINVGSAGAFVTNGGALGTPSSGTLTNATGLPISTGVSGLGSGVATALGVATNGNGGVVLVSGAQTVGNCLKWSAAGLVDTGAACAGNLTFPATVAGTTNSGGIPYFSGATTLSSSAALTANAPVIGGGAGVAPTVGTRSGNTTTFATTSGALTSGNCAKFDASGNIVDNGATCGGGGGSGTVNSGTAGQFAYYPASAAAVSGNANFTISGSDLTAGVAGSAVGTLSFGNATSGTIKLSPTTGALGSSVITLPATTGTMTVLGNTATGSGSVVLATSPALTTPNLGTPSAATLTNATGLPVSTGISGLGTGVATSLAANIAAAADVQAGTSTSKLVVPSALSGAAAVQTLTDAATVNWDMSAGYNAKVTLGGNRTMAAPTNIQAGITYALQVIQDGTGSRTVTWNAAFKWGANGAPTLSTAAAKIDIVTCFASDTSTLLCNYTLGF